MIAVSSASQPARTFSVFEDVWPTVHPLDPSTLSVFYRGLLDLNGTVTRFLAATTLEPIRIIKLTHEEHVLDAPAPRLDASAGTTVVDREVLLQGEQSGTLHAYARSLLVPARIPAAVREELATTNHGLGQAMMHHRLETYREILSTGRQQARSLQPAIPELGDHELIVRTYQVYAGGSMMMLIHEKFPIYPDPWPKR